MSGQEVNHESTTPSCSRVQKATHKKGSDPEIESKCSLELNGVLDEPVRDVVDIEVLLYLEDEIRVGTARPVLPVCPCLPARPRRRLPPLPSVEPPPPLIRGFRTEPGKNDLHYCQRTTACGDCCLRPAGAERSWFGNTIFGWAVRVYVSMRKTRTKSITAS